MDFRIYRHIYLCIILLVWTANHLQAQDTTASKKETFPIQRGTILTGFSFDATTASRDNYNHEFERAFSRLHLTVEGMYFISDRIGVGPIIGYEYLYQDFEDPTNFFDPDDRWFCDFLYGARTGWYTPFEKLFASDTLGNTYLFISGGVSWLWNRKRREGHGTIEKENRFGYQFSSGLLIPVGKKISLEWKIGWESRREHYRYQAFEDGEMIIDFNEVKWRNEISLGIGLKVIL